MILRSLALLTGSHRKHVFFSLRLIMFCQKSPLLYALPPHEYFFLFHAEQPQLSQPPLTMQILQSLDHLWGSFTGLALWSPCLPLTGEPHTPEVSRGEGCPPQPTGNSLPSTGYCRVTLLVHVQPTSTPRSSPAKLFFSRLVPSTYWCLELFLPRSRTLHFPLLNLLRFPLARFSSLLRSLWTAAHPASPWATHPSSDLLRVLSAPSLRSLRKRLSRTSPRITVFQEPQKQLSAL